MKKLLQPQYRHTLQNAVIIAGNPELFIWILLIEAYCEKRLLADVASRVQKQVEQVGHPILITLVALLQNNEKSYSPALRHYTLQHRLNRCLSYFPLIKAKLKLPVSVPELSHNKKANAVRNEDFEHLILAYCGLSEWTSRDVSTRSRLNLTEENVLLSLEYYLFHYGDHTSVYHILETANLAKMTAPQINAWVGLMSAAGKITFTHIKRLLSNKYYREGNVELQAQCHLFFDECKIASDLIPSAKFTILDVPLQMHPHFQKQVQKQIVDSYISIANRVTANSSFPFWFKWIGLTVVAAIVPYIVSMHIVEHLANTRSISYFNHIVAIVGLTVSMVCELAIIASYGIPALHQAYYMPYFLSFTKGNRSELANQIEQLLDRVASNMALQSVLVSDAPYYQITAIFRDFLRIPETTWQHHFAIHQLANLLQFHLGPITFEQPAYAVPIRKSEAEFRSVFFAIQGQPNAEIDDAIQVKTLEETVFSY